MARYHDPYTKAIMRGQTASKKPTTHEDSYSSDDNIQGLTDLLVDYPNKTSDNNSNMSESSTNSEMQSPWGCQELRLDEDNDYWNNVLRVHDQTSSEQT
ncbi:hypothetical protein SUGI_0225470 [Cryptomeria japonica]|nr:hypothetical protein SUGI_0225470 [Cryptomeria japonica]